MSLKQATRLARGLNKEAVVCMHRCMSGVKAFAEEGAVASSSNSAKDLRQDPFELFFS